ncbi:single-stranded-DNA-specific exonuclease RecJ [Candidatus Uhrbacteria bacterium]|nr:single-stranded-DNA-specific exonuclease RecJ [Candidatus Uhrbacteria bacterium]
MFKKSKWIVADLIDEEVKQKFPEIHPALLQLLWNRNLRTQEEMDVYLGPDWSRDVHSPALFRQMNEAVQRIFYAFEHKEVITIHGDYDADGVCGSALLLTCLRDISRELSFDVSNSIRPDTICDQQQNNKTKITSYIPHREKEGYGLSIQTVEHLNSHEHTKLIIAVDCGISNKQAIDFAKTLGIDTIVCDHHTVPDQLPEKTIIIHPLVCGETYPSKNLCGTAVAFKLACSLYDEARRRGKKIPEGYEKWLLDLVAIATVTDVMPLVKENRVLEMYGLLVLNKTRRIGLKKLIEISGGKFGTLDTTSIGFQIGPRLNAAGRINHATEALDLLMAEDETQATELAIRLQETNKERQRQSSQMYDEAKVQLSTQPLGNLLIAVSDCWAPGLVGLVAGKLVGEHQRPVYVIGKSDELYVGSGRTFGNFDVTAALQHASLHLEKFGGHPQACGFSIRGEENLKSAIELLHSFAAQTISEKDLTPRIEIEKELTLEEVDWNLFEGIERCRPFGQGNPEPLFCALGLSLVSFVQVGNEGKHLKLSVQSPAGRIMPAIAFGFGDRAQNFILGQPLDLAFHIRVNEWNGNRELQLQVEDISN